MEPGTGTNMLQRLSQVFPALQELILITFSLLGLALIGTGLLRLLPRHCRGRGPGPAICCLVAGSLLLALPTSMESLSHSLFADADPRRILSAVNPNHSPGRGLLLVVINFMTLIGWLAGGRGLYLIAQSGGRLARGLVHLLGGVCLVNLLPLAHAIGTQLGIETRISSILEAR